jgi:hypothetical protein
MAGLPLDEKVEVTVNGKPAKLADLAKGMTATLETVPGKSSVRRITAFAAPKAESYSVKAIDLKKRTVTLSLESRKLELKDVPLARGLELEGYKRPKPPNVAGGAIVLPAGGEKVAVKPDDLKPGERAAVEFGFEKGVLVVKKMSIVVK